MNSGGIRPLGGIRELSEGTEGSLGAGLGGNMSPRGILGKFRGTRSPGELEEGLREYQVPRGCLQGGARSPGGAGRGAGH